MLLTFLLFFQSGYDRAMLDPGRENKRAHHVYEKIGLQRVSENKKAVSYAK